MQKATLTKQSQQILRTLVEAYPRGKTDVEVRRTAGTGMRLLLHMRLGLLEDAMLVRRSYVKANPWFMSQTVFHATPLGVRYVRSLDESLDITDLLHS